MFQKKYYKRENVYNDFLSLNIIRVNPKFCVNVKKCKKEYMMRPIVRAVGLIGILAQDYSIAKMKCYSGILSL